MQPTRRSALSPSRTRSAGLEVHTASIAVASVAQAHGAEVISLGTIGTRQGDIDTLLRQLQSKSTQLVVVYDAGPCGSWLYRSLMTTGCVCWVVAPSLLPTKAGDRVTTDRRDAMPLARLRRSGALTPVYVPAVDDAASRALSRAREETLRDLQAATLRRTAFWLRHDIRSTGRANWRPAPLRWLSEVGCPTPAQPMVFQEDVQTVTAQTERLQRLAHALHEQGKTWRFSPGVEALQALRGVQVTVAVIPVAELGDLTRCENPRQLLHDLGRTPAEYSRGARRQQGGMPQTGHTHARRALVEGAWAYRSPATGSRHLPRRLEKLPTTIQASSGKAQVRLCQRSRQLMATGQNAHQVVVASARECRAFMWAIAKQVAGSPTTERGRRVDAHVRGFHPLSEETQPRCGGTLGGVMRPQGPLVPSMRQAPDGGKEGGSQPTDSSVITRRVFLAPALPSEQGKTHEADGKKLLPTLDIGSHINATRQARRRAGARHERTLFAVACTRLLGNLFPGHCARPK